MGGDFSKNLQSESLMSFGNVPEDTSTLERVDFASDPYNFGWCVDNPFTKPRPLRKVCHRLKGMPLSWN